MTKDIELLRVSDERLVQLIELHSKHIDYLRANNWGGGHISCALELKGVLAELQSRRSSDMESELGECRYCANTGWFYGDPDLKSFCGCAFGKLREELSTDMESERPALAAQVGGLKEALIAEFTRLRRKHSSPTGDEYNCGQWDMAVRLEQAAQRILSAISTETGKGEDGEVRAAMSLMTRLGVTKLTWGDLASVTTPPSPSIEEGEPVAKRWLIEEHQPSGSIRWSVVEHEQDARSRAGSMATPTTVTALYARPVPVVTDEMRETLNEILDEDASNKWVWKTHESQDAWLREKILPLMRQLRAALSSKEA